MGSRRSWRVLSAAALVAAAACAEPSKTSFSVSVRSPLSRRDEVMARRLGIGVVGAAPEGSAAEPAYAGNQMADWSRLRFMAARALAERRTGVFFVLPELPAGREFADYPEEWQALARVARELALARPIYDEGVDEPVPFPLSPGIEGRAWRRAGRSYALLVNSGPAQVPFDENALDGWRALFEVRSDPRELLSRCPSGRCLAPGAVLWVESRLLMRAARG